MDIRTIQLGANWLSRRNGEWIEPCHYQEKVDTVSAWTERLFNWWGQSNLSRNQNLSLAIYSWNNWIQNPTTYHRYLGCFWILSICCAFRFPLFPFIQNTLLGSSQFPRSVSFCLQLLFVPLSQGTQLTLGSGYGDWRTKERTTVL